MRNHKKGQSRVVISERPAKKIFRIVVCHSTEGTKADNANSIMKFISYIRFSSEQPKDFSLYLSLKKKRSSI